MSNGNPSGPVTLPEIVVTPETEPAAPQPAPAPPTAPVPSNAPTVTVPSPGVTTTGAPGTGDSVPALSATGVPTTTPDVAGETAGTGPRSAASSGVAPHFAWINGILIESGNVTQMSSNAQSKFHVVVPMDNTGPLKGNQATIVVKNVAGTGTLFTGPIETVHNDFIRRAVALTGTAALGLNATKVSKSFVNQTGAQITAQVCGMAGVPCEANLGGLLAGTKMSGDWVKIADNVTAAYLIHKLTEQDTARWRIDPQGTLHYEPREGLGKSSFTVTYKPPSSQAPMASSAMHLVIIQNLLAEGTGATIVKSMVPYDKEVYVGQAKGPSGGQWTATYHVPNRDQPHAQAYANSLQEAISRHALTVQATVVGDPNIDPGGKLTLKGTGAFDGSYTIDQIHHVFGMGGYTMTITALSMATGGGVWQQ